MGMGFVVVRYELKKEEKFLSELYIPKNKTFAVITEFHPSRKKFTYQVPDEWGRIHEITESVDENSARRMRVGDTVMVYRKTGTLFSRSHLVSRIESNRMYPGMLISLKKFFLYGCIFFAIQIPFFGILFFSKGE